MSAPPDEPPLLFPVGQLAGTFPDETGGHHHEIRRGGRIHEVADADLAAWAFAHGSPSPTDVDKRWTRATVEQRIQAMGVAGAAAIIAGLRERGLLVETPTQGSAAIEFARTHRPVPTMYGLGNSPEEPWRYAIGLLGQEVVHVGRPVFDVWAWAHVDGDLWRGCESFAEHERTAGGTDPAVCDPARVLAGFLGALHTLLDAQAVFLDPVGSGTS